MKFYDTGNPYNSGVHYVNDLLGLASGDVAVYTLAQKARAFNTNKYKLAAMVMNASDMWSWDDNTKTDFNIATTTLVAGQRDYTLPTDALGIERVEIMDNAGNFHKLAPMDESDRGMGNALTNYGESNAFPTKYWLRGRSLFLDPAPDATSVTLAAGLKIYFPREVNEMTAATTTTEIGFDKPGDQVVCLMAAEEFAVRMGWIGQLDRIQMLLYGDGRHKGLLDVYLRQIATRVKDMKPAFRLKEEDME